MARLDRSAMDVSEEERRATYDARWEIGGLFFLGSFNDLLLNPESNATAASYVRERIAEIVDDPETAAMLSPDTTIGCKRLVVDTDYFRTFNRSNVSLVDVAATPVEQITETAVVVDGVHHQVDDIVFATGFDAMTGSLDRIDITGRGGRTLRDAVGGPDDPSGASGGRFPEPVHRHRSRQPVGAHQHGRVDRAARRVHP